MLLGDDSVVLAYVLWLALFVMNRFCLVNFFGLDRNARLAGPAEGGQAGGFGTAELLIPVSCGRRRFHVLSVLFMDGSNIFVFLMLVLDTLMIIMFVLNMQRLGYRLGSRKDGFVLWKGGGQGRYGLGSSFRRDFSDPCRTGCVAGGCWARCWYFEIDSPGNRIGWYPGGGPEGWVLPESTGRKGSTGRAKRGSGVRSEPLSELRSTARSGVLSGPRSRPSARPSRRPPRRRRRPRKPPRSRLCASPPGAKSVDSATGAGCPSLSVSASKVPSSVMGTKSASESAASSDAATVSVFAGGWRKSGTLRVAGMTSVKSSSCSSNSIKSET